MVNKELIMKGLTWVLFRATFDCFVHFLIVSLDPSSISVVLVGIDFMVLNISDKIPLCTLSNCFL